MAASKIILSNLALTKVGARRITALDEDSAEARAISAVYDDIRDEVLAEHPWSFALKRIALSVLDITPAMTEDNMTIVYAKPSDLIRPYMISDATATIKVESNGILSDTASLKMIYVYRNDDPLTYFAKFTQALATRLAAELCFNLSESRNKAVDLMKEYTEIVLPSAVSMDSQQSTPLQIKQDEWEAGRLIGGQAFMVRPGDQTWTLVW